MRRTGPSSLALASAAALALLAGTGGAEAHRLKLFVTAEAGEISGYAFFVGGGRPEGVPFVVKDGQGREVGRGVTDGRGDFRWRPPAAADYTIVVDTGDGHWSEAKIDADRLAEAGPAAAATVPSTAPVPAAPSSPAAPAPAACAGRLDEAALARGIERAVDGAVARQMRPLLEAYDQAEGRLRFNDVAGGVGMIVGLAGAALWASARRRERKDRTP